MSYGAEGEQFQAAFAELQLLTGNDPEALRSTFEGNQRLQGLCDKIKSHIQVFEAVEEGLAHAFAPNIPSSGIKARREFDARWRDAVAYVANRNMRQLLDKLVINIDTEPSDMSGAHCPPTKAPDPLSDQIDDWKYDGLEEARSLEAMVDYALSRREVDEDLGWMDLGFEAWDKLKSIGLQPAEVYWRRKTVPFILVPPHVSSHYGQNRASLYRRLHQAGQAFVFGAPLAALSLQRAVLEEVLKRHWNLDEFTVRNASLEGLIEEADLPAVPAKAKAQVLRRMANDALHNDPEKLTEDGLDRAIINNFLILRFVIENAPNSAGAQQRSAN